MQYGTKLSNALSAFQVCQDFSLWLSGNENPEIAIAHTIWTKELEIAKMILTRRRYDEADISHMREVLVSCAEMMRERGFNLMARETDTAAIELALLLEKDAVVVEE